MKRKFNIYLNAPITLGFVAISLIAFLLNMLTQGSTNLLLFSTYRSSLLSPFTIIRLFTHIFGHISLEHLISNMIYILLLGPILEEKYHEKLITIILAVAFVTGLSNNIFFPNQMLLGASGIVFAFILLSSITGNQKGIPLTLIVVAIFYLGNELYTGLTSYDQISQISHLLGGFIGLILGLYYKDF